MSIKLDAALKGKFVNVNGEKEKIVKLDRASGSYVLESGMHVPGDDLTKKGRGLFYTPPRKQRKTAGAKPAAKPARRAQSESADVSIDRELKGKFITLNPGTRGEDKQKIVAIVKDVGYKTEDGTVVPAGDVFKKGRGVFANTKKKSAAKETPAKTSSGLKPKSEVKKSIKPAAGGLKPKQQVKRRGERTEDEARIRVKKFTQDIAQQIEDGCADAISEALANGTLASLDVQVVALNVTFEDRGLLLEAAFVPGNAKEAEVTAFTEELFGEQTDGGADEELDDEELDDEELDEEEEDDSEEEDEDLDEEEEDEELDDEEEDESDDEEESDEEDFDDEEEEDESDEEDEEEVDFDAIAEEIGADAGKVAKYGQLYIDADFDASVTVGNKVRDSRTKTVFHFVGSTTETADDAKIVIAKKGGKLVTISIDTFAKHFAEV